MASTPPRPLRSSPPTLCRNRHEAGTEGRRPAPYTRSVDLHDQLRELFGFDDFRPGQEAVVRNAIAGQDTLAIMPTGSGKSLTYQLAAVLRPTPTLVLSPLIALMKDQVDSLPPSLAETTTFVNSSLSPDEAAARVRSFTDGRVRLLYAAPERLRQGAFATALGSAKVGLVVVDEVHCVSMWGHDFRPDYLFIRRALSELGDPALLGMTATATPRTASEIASALGRDPEVVRTTVVRPNLRYDVQDPGGAEDRLRILIERLQQLDGASAIVYARSRRSCERLASTLASHGLRATHYHAGLESDERTRVQDAFVRNDVQVVVATTAFGMGIDKPDVRLVALVNHPDSLESYVQMVGRAGRDGRPSDTVLLAGGADASSLRRFAVADVPTPTDLRGVYRALRAGNGLVTLADLAPPDAPHDPRVLVGMLEQAGLVARGFDEGRRLKVELLPVPDDATERIATLLTRYRVEAEARAERMIGFAEASRCRHAQVAEHFGETLDEPCGSCDVCDPRQSTTRHVPVAAPLPSDPAAAIVAAVAQLRWPVGRRSLVAMLRGSVTAPASARRSPSFGLLAAASEATVTKWVRTLETAGALLVVEEDGFRVLRAVPGAALPKLGGGPVGDADPTLVAELRRWRLARAQQDAVPAYVVLHDSTLEEVASTRPTSLLELGAVKGFGPTKLERYGEDVLAVVAAG